MEPAPASSQPVSAVAPASSAATVGAEGARCGRLAPVVRRCRCSGRARRHAQQLADVDLPAFRQVVPFDQIGRLLLVRAGDAVKRVARLHAIEPGPAGVNAAGAAAATGGAVSAGARTTGGTLPPVDRSTTGAGTSADEQPARPAPQTTAHAVNLNIPERITAMLPIPCLFVLPTSRRSMRHSETRSHSAPGQEAAVRSGTRRSRKARNPTTTPPLRSPPRLPAPGATHSAHSFQRELQLFPSPLTTPASIKHLTIIHDFERQFSRHFGVLTFHVITAEPRFASVRVRITQPAQTRFYRLRGRMAGRSMF